MKKAVLADKFYRHLCIVCREIMLRFLCLCKPRDMCGSSGI